MSAFAGNSGEAVYETEVPSVESHPSTGGNHSGKSATNHKSSNNPTAEGSVAETGGAGPEESEKGSESSEGHKKEGSSSKQKKSNPSTGAGGNGNKPTGGANAGGSEQSSIGESKGLGSTQPGKNAAAKSGGGSSPVLPVLIAVVVLAAISIGVVLYRQRKSGQGGSDGRFSSSNAS